MSGFRQTHRYSSVLSRPAQKRNRRQAESPETVWGSIDCGNLTNE
jgi:hypothetical protein